ncbi:DUF1150 family protein [Bartonella sp. DGB1]|uniref:BQ00720 family protein n=1 Tax=Bartonella sp. DGB1 TaxID=3239807 RepID=UPI003526C20F
MANNIPSIDMSELHSLGQGKIAYVRKIKTEELAKNFPSLPPLAAGVEIWALFGASGEPLILSEAQHDILMSAKEQDLETFSVH